MSHFTQMRTTITDLEVLKGAVEQLGHTLEIGEIYASGYNRQQTKVDAKIVSKTGYDIGFVKDKDSNSYTITADWWGAEHEFGQADVFTGRLTTTYAEKAAIKTGKSNRWNLVNREETDEHIVLRFRQW